VTDAEALDGFRMLASREGILPALESAHAVAYTARLIQTLPENSIVLVNLSGRGDKDVQSVAEALAR
jgi:tryptophan synthase beta chain